MNAQTILLILIASMSMFTLIRVSKISNKSRQIIPAGWTKYHFEIINGPSLEQIIANPYFTGESMPGFEVSPAYEPYKYISDMGRKGISYIFFPDSVLRYSNAANSDETLYLTIINEIESAKKDVEKFCEQENKILRIEACIRLGRKLSGRIPAYKLDITYNCDIRKGNMVVLED